MEEHKDYMGSLLTRYCKLHLFINRLHKEKKELGAGLLGVRRHGKAEWVNVKVCCHYFASLLKNRITD